MKSVGGFLRNVVQRKETGLMGKTLQVGPHSVRVEAHLGDGGFAAIYRVRDINTSSAFALKHMRLGADPEALRDCQIEVKIMERLRDCANVLNLRAVAYIGPKGQEEEAFILLDLCRHNLVDHMRQMNRPLQDADVLCIFQSVCKAVAAMHNQSSPLIHRDLKAENILQHSNGSWVLCDFGSTTNWSGRYEGANDIMVAEEEIRKYTTPAYRPPEMFDLYSREHIGPKADIWSLGVLFFYMCYQRLPFEGECKLQVLNGDFNCPLGRPEEFVMLINSMLKVSPAARPDIDTVLRRLQCLISSPSSRQPVVDSKPAQAVTSPRDSALKGPAAQQTLPSLRANPASSGAWDMGGWDLNAWDKAFTSVPPPSSTPQVDASSYHRLDVGSAANQPPPQRGQKDALSAGRIEEPSRTNSRSMLSAAGLPPGAPLSRPISPAPSPLLPISEADNSSHSSRYPPAPRGHITSKPEANPGAAQAEIVCLQQQLVEARAANQKLGAIIKHQQSTIDQLQGHNDAWEAQFRETNSMKLSTSGVSLSNNTAVVRPSTSGVSLSNSAAAVRPENSTSLPGTPQRSLSNTSPVPSSARRLGSEQQSLSPDHPLKSLEDSLLQLDPFEPFAASESAPMQPAAPQSAPSGTIKKMPSRFGMKSRGSSFTAFEDEFDPDLGDVGHLKMDSAAEHAKEAQKLPADFDPFAQGSEADALQPVSTAATGRKHRRTTSEPTPLDSWEPWTGWP